MDNLFNTFIVFLVLVVSSFPVFSQNKTLQSKHADLSEAKDEKLVEFTILLEDENAYYCLESPDLAVWIPVFEEQMNRQLKPLLSKGGEFEFMGNNTVRVLFPPKNMNAVVRFWKKQETARAAENKEGRKKGSTKRCQ